MTTTVKHFHSAMTGAPVLSGTAGALIAVLDACLVNGFGLKTADSVVVSGGIATATFSTGHSFEPDVIALAAGATPAGLNGEKRVLTTATNVITFDAAGIADGTATGTITFKLAPAGWAKEFSGTNLAAYRSEDLASTRMFLRVVDTGATNARVVGYESMTEINAGAGMFPLEGQISGGGWWPKASAADGNSRAWTVIADGKCFWLHIHTAPSVPGASGCIWGFGDFTSYKSVNPFACVLFANNSDISLSSGGAPHAVEQCGYQGYQSPIVARSFTGLGSSIVAGHLAESYFTNSGVSGGITSSNVPNFPNGPNNGLVLTRKILVENGLALLGVLRGVLVTPQNCNTSFVWRDKIDGQGSYAGRKLMAVKCGSPSGLTSQGVIFIDITGPWG